LYRHLRSHVGGYFNGSPSADPNLGCGINGTEQLRAAGRVHQPACSRLLEFMRLDWAALGRMMRKLLFAAAVVGLASLPASATTTNFSLNPGDTLIVTVATSACANQLVLNYSNSCALMGQAWGE
jgi:hypothetical protein